MSRQRKRHRILVRREKYTRSVKKVFSNRSNYTAYLGFTRIVEDISSSYKGTRFRGLKRWR